MKKLLISMFFVFIVTFVSADTNIYGGTVEGTWTANGSPYNIMGEIFIDTTNTLTIEPGVTVLFAGHYRFTFTADY